MSALPFGRGLVVSCQARPDNPMHGTMGAMALAAAQAGAVAIRANGADDVLGIAATVGLPVIGLEKVFAPDGSAFITPDLAAAERIAAAGAATIAVDCSRRMRATPLADLIRAIREGLGIPVFADVSTLEEGLEAEALGAACVATTLSGYTPWTRCDRSAPPDLALVEALARRLAVPVIAEGRYDTPALARAALDAGAYAVVVGTAITNPREIARGFVQALAT